MERFHSYFTQVILMLLSSVQGEHQCRVLTADTPSTRDGTAINDICVGENTVME